MILNGECMHISPTCDPGIEVGLTPFCRHASSCLSDNLKDKRQGSMPFGNQSGATLEAGMGGHQSSLPAFVAEQSRREILIPS